MATGKSIVIDVYATNFRQDEVMSRETISRSKSGNGHFMEDKPYNVQINVGNDWNVKFEQSCDEQLQFGENFYTKAMELLKSGVKTMINNGHLTRPIKVAYNDLMAKYEGEFVGLPITYKAPNGITFHIYLSDNP